MPEIHDLFATYMLNEQGKTTARQLAADFSSLAFSSGTANCIEEAEKLGIGCNSCEVKERWIRTK